MTVHPRHPSVSVEDLIERLHADGWRAVELRVAPEPMRDGRRHIAWVSQRIGDGPRFVALSDPDGYRWITHLEQHVIAEVWEHSTGAALAALVGLLDEHRVDPDEVEWGELGGNPASEAAVCAEDHRLCVGDGWCRDEYPDDELICTRPPGHDGLHVACAPTGHDDDHNLASWGGESQ